ncbi:hypothetical protein [Flectobacillus major]|uniref:hypothetical protein n=1 Tax=Flectobacillus major TaxID=103 RepID=UPI0003FCED8C|nr:hypothetical protein [Flectobacillus major]
MFGLFKRTKIEKWETDLLQNVIIKLPSEYSSFINQINDGLLRGVLVSASDILGYVAFTFHPNILKKYDKKKEQDFKLTNIKVYDNKSLSFVPYEIYISSGTISGYSLIGCKGQNVDVGKVDVSGFKKKIIGKSDYHRIMYILLEEEKKLLNPSEVYSILIDGKEYFHLKDLEDGDFIGIDENKVIYRITHNPLEKVVISKKLSEVLEGE